MFLARSGQEETVENYQTNDLYSAVGNAASETEASLSSAPSKLPLKLKTNQI